MVRWPGPGGGRAAKHFTNETEALSWAKERRKELGEVGEAFGSLAESERAALVFWRDLVRDHPQNPPPPLLTVLQEEAKRWKASAASVTVRAAIDAYEVAKRAEGLRPTSLQSLRSRCHRFAADFGSRMISTITTAEISDWLLTLRARRPRSVATGSSEVSLQAKRNHRLTLSGLFNFAVTRGWATENPVSAAARPKPPKRRPGILRPAEAARFFKAMEAEAGDLVPFWALRFFAGIREQEVLRMDWGMVDLKAAEVHLPETITKTGQPRTVKIEPALRSFLEPRARPSGPITDATPMSRRYWLAKVLEAVTKPDKETKPSSRKAKRPESFPVPLPVNAARHSFATYHLLAFRHAGETALQLGHGGSPELLHRHYKGIATEREAKNFWKIRAQKKPDNVVNISAARAKRVAAESGQKRRAKR